MKSIITIILTSILLQLTLPAFATMPCMEQTDEGKPAMVGACCKSESSVEKVCVMPIDDMEHEHDDNEPCSSDQHQCLCSWSHFNAVPTLTNACFCGTPPIFSVLIVNPTVLIDQLIQEPPFHPPKVEIS